MGLVHAGLHRFCTSPSRAWLARHARSSKGCSICARLPGHVPCAGRPDGDDMPMRVVAWMSFMEWALYVFRLHLTLWAVIIIIAGLIAPRNAL